MVNQLSTTAEMETNVPGLYAIILTDVYRESHIWSCEESKPLVCAVKVPQEPLSHAKLQSFKKDKKIGFIAQCLMCLINAFVITVSQTTVNNQCVDKTGVPQNLH